MKIQWARWVVWLVGAVLLGAIVYQGGVLRRRAAATGALEAEVAELRVRVKEQEAQLAADEARRAQRKAEGARAEATAGRGAAAAPGGAGAVQTGAKGAAESPAGAKDRVGSADAGQTQAVAEAPEAAARRAAWHRRYDDFMNARGMTRAQIERYIDLAMQKETLRADLQAAVREQGLTAGTKSVEDLRTTLNRSIDDEMRALLGGWEGMNALGQYDRMYVNRVAYVEPLLPAFAAAQLPLEAAQVERLTALVMTHQEHYRAAPSDLGMSVRVDWPAVIATAAEVLSPAQLDVLRAQAARRDERR